MFVFVRQIVSSLKKKTCQEVGLLLATVMWASTFVVVQEAMKHSGPLFFVGLRFVVASLVAGLFFWRSMSRWRWQDVWAGSVVGLTIFLAYGLQTAGLQTLGASQSAFITSLYVPLVPLLQWLVFGKMPRVVSLLGIALAFAGLVCLTGPGAEAWGGLGLGEGLTLAAAAVIAIEIVLIGHFAPRVSVERVSVLQLFSAGALAWLAMPVVSEPLPAFSWVWLLGALGLGVVSALVQLAMNWAQRDVSPTRATLIYASGPIWGGLFGLMAGESLTRTAVLGAGLIVVGMVVSEWRPRRWREAAR